MGNPQTPPANETRAARALRKLTTADGDPTNYTTPEQFRAGVHRLARTVIPWVATVAGFQLLGRYLQRFFTEREVTAGFIGALIMGLALTVGYAVLSIRDQRARNSRKGK